MINPKDYHIRPYLEQALRLNLNVRVMRRNNGNCSSWVKLSNWDSKLMGDPTDIELLSSEIVFETDCEERFDNKNMAEVIMSHLRTENIGFECWFSGNKSYHIYTCFPDLDKLESEQRSLVKVSLAKRIAGEMYDMLDSALFKSKAHMLSIRNGIHPKTGLRKEIVVKYKHTNFNGLPIEIIEGINERYHKSDAYIDLSVPVPKLAECGLINLALEKKIVSGNRNTMLCPNFLALNPGPDLIRRFSGVQGMKISDVCGWKRSGCYKGYFSCKQMKEFASKHNLLSVCKKCNYDI